MTPIRTFFAAVLLTTLAFAATAAGPSAVNLPNPSAPGSLQPNWSVTPDGNALLSWIEPAKNGLFTLRYAVRTGGNWSAPHTIAGERHFFRHPAEVPEVAQLSNGHWLAHWVEMPMESSDAEFIYVSSSTDGMTWSAPVMANKDRSPVQHGLVSMAGNPAGDASLFWLETPKGEDGPGYLIRTTLNAAGKPEKEDILDKDICSCCPTAVAKTSRGLLVAYRDHTPEDVRDIAVIRYENGKWTPSKIVHDDKWVLNACPTNAAAVAANGDRVALAWYTGADDNPRVELVFSSDAGTTFTKPIVVSTGHAYGYTSVALSDDGGATVSWLEQGKENAARVLARHVTAAGMPGPVVEAAQGGRMALGYPRVVHAGKDTFIAWCNPKSGSPLVTAQLK